MLDEYQLCFASHNRKVKLTELETAIILLLIINPKGIYREQIRWKLKNKVNKHQIVSAIYRIKKKLEETIIIKKEKDKPYILSKYIDN